ncbi:YdcF family protein [Saccharolobus islandicus]|uniref:DUF218 domain-containing protein n=2 Tax=Saccharolobus islandicus TaxID=43080 RepID=C3MWE4_SACI4|nr:YdcF family protein [Sulfolobus islandicus]ACP37602.1 protein of unknown function DUF218 [Sulfolobus islandicus M.14.25]ACP54745.1 protein of unknown function DUF218 [Sulfolobus islandicus M.16.27]
MYDAIVVLGGGKLSEGRIDEAIRLYKQGIAKYLIIVGGKEEVSEMYKKVRSKIQNIENVYVDNNSLSTADNAYYAKKIIEKLNIKSILIVTSNFHIKRALKTFELFLRGKYKIDIIGVQDNPDTYALTKEIYLEELLHIFNYLKDMRDEDIKTFFDTIRTPVNKILRKAIESGILRKIES